MRDTTAVKKAFDVAAWEMMMARQAVDLARGASSTVARLLWLNNAAWHRDRYREVMTLGTLMVTDFFTPEPWDRAPF